MKNKIEIIVKPELCIQCHACETACRIWRQTDRSVSYRRVVAYEEGCFPNVCVQYVSESCRHCDDPECLQVCPVNAIKKEDDGAVVVDRNICISCKVCKSACRFHVPQFGKDGTMQKCDLCHDIEIQEQRFPCVRMCPTGALSMKITE